MIGLDTNIIVRYIAQDDDEQSSIYYDWEEGKADFSDYLLARVNSLSGCSMTYTFDKNALRHRLFVRPK